jgi:hypothetical protein
VTPTDGARCGARARRIRHSRSRAALDTGRPAKGPVHAERVGLRQADAGESPSKPGLRKPGPGLSQCWLRLAWRVPRCERRKASAPRKQMSAQTAYTCLRWRASDPLPTLPARGSGSEGRTMDGMRLSALRLPLLFCTRRRRPDERSEIRDSTKAATPLPDFALLIRATAFAYSQNPDARAPRERFRICTSPLAGEGKWFAPRPSPNLICVHI